MLASSHRFGLFDYFRVPYELAPTGDPIGRLGREDAAVFWPAQPPATAGRRGLWRLEGAPLYARVAPEAEVRAWERGLRGRWDDLAEVLDGSGRRISAVRRRDDGALLLPFDPADAMESLWSEAYASERAAAPSQLRRLAMSGYYAVRPALPRAAQLGLRRSFSRIQARTKFPRWPVESGLHDLYDHLFRWLSNALGGPLPAVAPWPGGKRWALVLTHDVEHAEGYDSIPLLRDLEHDLGYRSAWYLVPERDYTVDDEVVRSLRAAGFEVGVHGLHHDGRDLARGHLASRLPAMTAWRDRWEATGFRSPATHRDWDAMPTLGFAYDSSSFDTDPFEPQAGGCCSWLPFHNRDLVELPLTLTMDHTLFVILRRDTSLWEEKADYLRARGGLALLLTHPDYMLAPGRLDAYRSFLSRYADDETAWRALPGDVAGWWNRRAASRIETNAGEPYVVGPAAEEARIVMLGAEN